MYKSWLFDLIKIRLPQFILLLVIITGCSDDNPKPAESLDLRQPWVQGSPEEFGVNNADSIVEIARNLTRLTSFLVVKDDKLVMEEYFKGFYADSLHDVRSITKSILCLLVGIAIDQGLLADEYETIGSIDSTNSLNLDEQQQQITIRDLLTMSSGFGWDEANYNDWILSGDYINYLLALPMVSTPGNLFNYNSPAVYLLGIILEKQIGIPIPEFADQNLFNKIGISERRWEPSGNGQVNTSAGIDLKARDLAKIGQLILQKGKSGNEQIISQYWLDKTLAPKYGWRSDYGVLTDYTYGYLWWIRDVEVSAYFAWGFGGQYIFVLPDRNLVIVTTTNYSNSADVGGVSVLEQEALDLIINTIIKKF